MKKWFVISEKERLEIINQVSVRVGISPTAIEKDLWVIMVLNAIFQTEYKDHLIFKGGTSLSKDWNIIDRFSEDIDLAIDRSYFGFTGDLNKSQVRKLRKTSCEFISTSFFKKLEIQLKEKEVNDFEINVEDLKDSDTDPIAISINYKSLTEKVEYIQPRILVELSSRSLRDPFINKELQSFIGQSFPDEDFVDSPIVIPTAAPHKTLLEKIFLLHEEFQKPRDKEIRSHRMTRHLYDIERLMDSEFLEEALNNDELYLTILKHREMLTNISWVDYKTHLPGTLSFIPPESEIEKWKEDYKKMQESMFYGETSTFDRLLEKLKSLQDRINKK